MSKEKVEKVSALDRLCQEAMGEGKTFGHPDDPARTVWPELWRWLTVCYLGRDRVKQPASLSIRMGPDGVLVSLYDRDLGVSVDAAATNMTDAFAAVEAALTGPSPPIKSNSRKEPHLRKRRSAD